jgi:hypothetical protein
MTLPLNNHHICIVCRTRADGIGVGRPGRIGWCCHACGPQRAMEVYRLSPKALDEFEKLAIAKVIEKLDADPLTVPRDDLPAFLAWLIEEFGIAVREEIDSGRAPF